MQWFMLCIRKYVDFSGRARRKEYWMFALVSGVVSLVLYLLAVGLMAAGSSTDPATGQSSPGILGMLVMSVYGLWGVFLFIPSLAVTVRRLHDTDRSGWWILISLVPFVGGIILLVFECMDSTPGPNRFGPNPKGVGGGAGYGQFQPGQGQYGQSQYGQIPGGQFGQAQPGGQYGQQPQDGKTGF